MLLKPIKETETGLNTDFINVDSGRHLTREHIIEQINKGNKNYDDYQVVNPANGLAYIRSKPDGSIENNIE